MSSSDLRAKWERDDGAGVGPGERLRSPGLDGDQDQTGIPAIRRPERGGVRERSSGRFPSRDRLEGRRGGAGGGAGQRGSAKLRGPEFAGADVGGGGSEAEGAEGRPFGRLIRVDDLADRARSGVVVRSGAVLFDVGRRMSHAGALLRLLRIHLAQMDERQEDLRDRGRDEQAEDGRRHAATGKDPSATTEGVYTSHASLYSRPVHPIPPYTEDQG